MTRRVSIFYNRDLINDYVSGLKLSFISIGLEQELVVHLVVGIHVADVAVDDQVLDSIVVSIPACHAGDRGSIPRRGAMLLLGSLWL